MLASSQASALVSGGDLVVVIVSIFVALFFMHRVRSGKLTDVAKEIAVGVVWVNIGMILNMSRLAIERYYEWLYLPHHEWVHSAFYLALLPIAFVIYGFGLHLAPVLKAVFGADYIQKYIAVCFVLYGAILFTYWVMR